jgi:hypothetical protein
MQESNVKGALGPTFLASHRHPGERSAKRAFCRGRKGSIRRNPEPKKHSLAKWPNYALFFISTLVHRVGIVEASEAGDEVQVHGFCRAIALLGDNDLRLGLVRI